MAQGLDPAVLKRYNRRRVLRSVLVVIVLAAVTLGVIEVLLRVSDPFGVAYFHDLTGSFYAPAIADSRGYVVPPGDYQASHWAFSILPDNTRAVPDTNPDAPRTMVFIGDSVTFGYGVNDAETFVNHIAQAYPDWHVINEAYPGWNIQNLENALALHPDADLVFVLTIYNDLSEPYRVAGAPVAYDSYIGLYTMMLKWLFFGYPAPSEADVAALEPAWRESITNIAADPRVIFLTIDTTNDYEQRVAAMFPDRTVILENYTGLVSTVDSHPNPDSHVFLAQQIIPVVADAITALGEGE